MDDDVDSSSTTDESFSTALKGSESISPNPPAEVEIQTQENVEQISSPMATNMFEVVQSPIVHLQKEFDDLNGYDSDDGPCYEAIQEEGPLILDETPVDDNIVVKRTAVVDVIAEVVEDVDEIDWFVLIPNDKIDKLRVTGLREALGNRGLSTDGKKSDLQVRLKDAMELRVPLVDPKNKQSGQDATVSGFSRNAKWCILVPKEEAVEDPTNSFVGAHAPTVRPEDVRHMQSKHNFEEVFERSDFTGVGKMARTHKNKKVMKDKHGKTLYEDSVRMLGMPDEDFLKEHKLTIRSSPAKFVEAFLPVSEMVHNTKCSIERWCRYTNLKAMLSFAGEKNYPYPDFKPFTVAELQQHLALYVVNGLCPSPRAEMKFQPQSVDPINGNDFIFRSFASNAERRHRHFKAFFCMQDPRLIVPDRNKEPNWKVAPLLQHMNIVNKSAWKLGRHISVDEQTIGFQGNHKDKLRITYKAEGDGFQCDALCQEGYTYTFYYRNQPAPKHYLDKHLSPLHARVMYMFDSLKDDYHRCGMDNLYISAKFIAAAYQHERKILVAGVCRKGGRGFPKAVLQEEVKSRTEQLRVRGTVKAAVLKGDEDCPNLIAVSVYDTKPVHFLSMSCETIEWITKERKVFAASTGKYEKLKFLRLNINDNYNKEMGHVDVSDQLRNYYRFDHYMRKRKWWWSIAFWGIGVQFVNAYVVYCKVMEANQVPRREWFSHYDFRKSVALEWINEKQMASRRNLVMMLNNESDDDSVAKKDGTSTGKKRPRQDDSAEKRTSKRIKEKEKEQKTKRSVRVSDASLQPDGALKIRLRRDLFHWPKQAKANQRCVIHRWSSGVEHKDKVLRCTDCEVHLCVGCYQLFHMVPNLLEKKEKMCKMFIEEQKERNKLLENKTPEGKTNYQINSNIQGILDECAACTPVEL
jgi:hypothetical protein